MKKSIYLVYDIPANGQSGDWFQSCPTFDRAQAIHEAEYDLAHLTASERARRHVYVGIHYVELTEIDTRSAHEIYDDMLEEDTWPVDHDVIELTEED